MSSVFEPSTSRSSYWLVCRCSVPNSSYTWGLDLVPRSAFNLNISSQCIHFLSIKATGPSAALEFEELRIQREIEMKHQYKENLSRRLIEELETASKFNNYTCQQHRNAQPSLDQLLPGYNQQRENDIIMASLQYE